MRHSSEELERVAPVRSHVDVYIAWPAVRPAERQRWQLPRVCRGRERGRHASRRHSSEGRAGRRAVEETLLYCTMYLHLYLHFGAAFPRRVHY